MPPLPVFSFVTVVVKENASKEDSLSERKVYDVF